MAWQSSRPSDDGWGKGHFLHYTDGYGNAVKCLWCGTTKRTAEACPHDAYNCDKRGHDDCHRKTASRKQGGVKPDA